jgi:hypothetical protein
VTVLSRDEFDRAIRRASAPGRMDIVRVIAPTAPLPEPDIFRRVLDAWRDPDVTTVVLQKRVTAAAVEGVTSC